jgi:hypothetical protein
MSESSKGIKFKSDLIKIDMDFKYYATKFTELLEK